MRVADVGTAPWWPAAASAAVAVMLARRGRWRGVVALLIAVVTGAANAAVGTPWGVAVGFGALNGLEALVIVRIATGGHQTGATFGFRQATRLVVACAGGAVITGVVTGAVVFAAVGEGFAGVAVRVAASHLSATLLLVPFFVVPRELFVTKRRVELLVQTALSIGVLILVFFPGQYFALTFAVFPSLIWLILRFPTGIVASQVLLAAIVSMVLTTTGAGPFAFEPPLVQLELLQAFAISIAVTTLVASGLINDQAFGVLRSRAKDELLCSGIVNAHAGFLLVQWAEPGQLIVLEYNPTSARHLAGFLDAGARLDATIEVFPVVRVIQEVLQGENSSRSCFIDPAGRTIEIRGKALRSHGSGPLVIIETQDVTEHVESERAWQQTLQNEKTSNYRLQELNRQKDVFLDAVGHELRTPTASILGYADLLAETAHSDPTTARSIDAITRNAERLTRLIDNLLIVTRTATLPLTGPRLFLLRDVIAKVIEELQPRALERGITVSSSFDADTLLESDREDVHRILINLLDNAIKFGLPGTAVTISGSTIDNHITIAVTDTGYSLTDEDVEHAFDRFYRAPDAVRDAIPGTGIGLSIAKALTSRLGGTIHLAATGATVTASVQFPQHIDQD